MHRRFTVNGPEIRGLLWNGKVEGYMARSLLAVKVLLAVAIAVARHVWQRNQGCHFRGQEVLMVMRLGFRADCTIRW